MLLTIKAGLNEYYQTEILFLEWTKEKCNVQVFKITIEKKNATIWILIEDGINKFINRLAYIVHKLVAANHKQINQR